MNRRIPALIVCCVMCAAFLHPLRQAAGSAEMSPASNAGVTEIPAGLRETGYLYYAAAVPNEIPSAVITLPGGEAVDTGGAGNITVGSMYDGVENCLLWRGQAGTAEWKFTVAEAGLYIITADYALLDEEGRELEYLLKLDGDVPFDEAARLLLRASWRDEGMPEQDRRGNDLRPAQLPVSRWQSAAFEDTEGFYDSQYQFYFSAGAHTLSLTSLKGEAAIAALTLAAKPEYIAYDAYARQYSEWPAAVGTMESWEAEQALYKSDATLYPISDRSCLTSTPYDQAKIKLNTIGGENWKYPGQTITWEITAPADGLYKLSFRLRQNIQLGMETHRALYLDGEIPFAEAAALSFPYSDKWVMYTPGDANGDYWFALTQGRHELTLKVVMGSAARTMRVIQDNVMKLNNNFLKMLAITGPTPDRLYEYRLDQQIPSLLPDFETVRAALLGEQERIVAEGGDAGGETAILGRLAQLLEQCANDPDTIPERMEDMKNTISALATYMIVLKEQTLELDKIFLSAPDEELPRATDTWLQAVRHQFNMFVSTFFEDYSVVEMAGEESERVLTVWIGGGRDQAQAVKSMANDTFTRDTGVEINLMLVQTDLMTAIVSGNAPDVFVNAGRGLPVDLAMRNAVVDLSALPGYDEVLTQFMPGAQIPYEYNGGVYALPVTQMFHMMFYRTDIFEELSIEPPETWDDFYEIIPILQRRNMEIGLPYEQMRGASLSEAMTVAEAGMGTRNILTTLMLQKGQPIYSPDKTRTAFSEETSIEAFKTWCGLYTMYGLPLWYDFYNRFRIGIMPLGIQGYWMYNYLSVAAPELRGLWAMTPIPGTRQADGSVNRAEGAGGEGAVIIKGTRDLEAAWEFLKWWTGADAQARYGHELEMLMGPSARYNTANLAAFSRLPWSAAEQELIMEQWRSVEEIPVVAGGYYTARNIDNAFRRVVQQQENPRDMLLRFDKDINDEIARKQKEFNVN